MSTVASLIFSSFFVSCVDVANGDGGDGEEDTATQRIVCGCKEIALGAWQQHRLPHLFQQLSSLSSVSGRQYLVTPDDVATNESLITNLILFLYILYF